ncbi:hypothetical protein F5X99DRAFT_121797 [Biscogniauxia marginata]|nr:hypothetical protein F5X99DRAFT_121797 [Biscogniauxia marginata]
MFPYKILTVGPVFFGQLQRVNPQGFVTNCTWQTSLLQDNWLGMYCNNDDWADYSYEWTWFDTNLCLVNNGGQLIAYDNGNYWPTCRNCTTLGSDVNYILNCICYQPDGQLAPATYDLNLILFNHNGSLGCFDHAGNKTKEGPI